MTYSLGRRSASFAVIAACFLPRAAWSQGSTALEIGILPNISARVLLAQYQPMRTFLTQSLGRPVQLSTAPSWNAFHARTLAFD